MILTLVVLGLSLLQVSGEALVCKSCTNGEYSADQPPVGWEVISAALDVECGDSTNSKTCPEPANKEDGVYKCMSSTFTFKMQADESGNQDTVTFNLRDCLLDTKNRSNGCYEPGEFEMQLINTKAAAFAQFEHEGKTCICDEDDCNPDCSGPFTVGNFCVLWWMVGVGIAVVVLLIVIIVAIAVCRCR